MIFDLRPSVLDDLGLLAAIRWYAQRQLEPRGIAVRYDFADLDLHLPAEIETALFRSVQEAVNNIARHSGAENALIEIDRGRDGLQIEIEDDGVGFDLGEVTSTVDSGRGLGLTGLRERMELLGGAGGDRFLARRWDTRAVRGADGGRFGVKRGGTARNAKERGELSGAGGALGRLARGQGLRTADGSTGQQRPNQDRRH